jgi:uncharacterized protein YpmB
MTPGQADEKEITKEEVPEAVLNSFTAAYPCATVREYAEEIEDGETYYEISFEDQGKGIDIVYLPDGKVAVLEELITIDELPAQVRKAITTEKITENQETFYEVKLADENGRTVFELVYSPDGKLIETEIKPPEDNVE